MPEKISRLYSIDVFRIICAIVVFLFHTRIHIGVDFGIFNNFISTGHIFMIAFFMLSGFSLLYVDSQRENLSSSGDRYKGVGKFLKRRFIGIYPLYISFYAVYVIWQILSVYALGETIDGQVSFLENIILAPIELILFQSVMPGTFSLLHNDGSWFISCIFICYIFYPYFAQIIWKNSKRRNIIFFIFLYLISSYAFLPAYMLHLGSIYSNPLLRFVEFLLGVIVAKYFISNSKNNIKKSKWSLVALGYMILIGVITVVYFKVKPVEAYNFIAIPCFGTILYFSARLEKIFEVKHFHKIIRILSENTYAFFLAQTFSWIPVRYLMSHSAFFEDYGSLKRFSISLLWTCLVTCILHYGMEKPLKKVLIKKIS